MQESAPEGVEIKYMPGFDINGEDENMDEVLEIVNKFDAVVMCIGEHVYSECKFSLLMCIIIVINIDTLFILL